MNKPQQPTKESVRNWLRTRAERRCPPPDPAQIRRELGWELIKPVPERKR
ncbi:hypothetical protein KY495_17505 [Massilia sp. PAMC28688]|nr:hypothetical protein [Massilia sp. PAMC28688]QYF92525.1 hypothetical protein KY495_17505 [Massilia sp. PAMC28688]